MAKFIKKESSKYVWEEDTDKAWAEIHILDPGEMLDCENDSNGNNSVRMRLVAETCIDNIGNVFDGKTPVKYDGTTAKMCIDRIDGFYAFIIKSYTDLTEKTKKKQEELVKN